MKERFGSLKCINIIREAYFRSTIKNLVNPYEKVLFVGGGIGDSLEDYCKANLLITFTDIDSEAVNHTKSIFKDKNYKIEYKCCSAYELPFESDSFDMVVSTLNGSYLNNDSIIEFRRVLKSGGLVLLSETTSEYIDYLRSIGRYDGCYILSSNYKTKILHPYVYSKQELLKITDSYDFECLQYDILSPNDLISIDEISSVILGLSRHLNKSINDVPLLYYMILRKKDESL